MGGWLNPSPPQVDVLHLRERAEKDFSKQKPQFLPLQLSFGYCPCLGSKKRIFVLFLGSLFLCVGTSQLIGLLEESCPTSETSFAKL